MAAYCDFLLLTSSLTLWTTVRAFSLSLPVVSIQGLTFKGIKKSKLSIISAGKRVVPIEEHEVNDRQTWRHIYEQYKAVKKMTNLINKTMGTNFTFYLAEVILDYATNIDRTFNKETTSDWLKVVVTIVYFSGAMAILLFSADVSEQVFILIFQEPCLS